MIAACPYCLPGSVHGPLNDDHVIPAKLGGTLTVRAHETCNSGAALYVDNPLMADPDVELLRGISGALNTRTGRFKGAQFPGALGDQAPALMRAGADGVVIEQVAAGVPQLAADDEFVFTLPPLAQDELAKRTAKVLDRLRAEHPGKTVELVSQEPRSAPVTIERVARQRQPALSFGPVPKRRCLWIAIWWRLGRTGTTRRRRPDAHNGLPLGAHHRRRPQGRRDMGIDRPVR
jgi:hypothetical protein